MTGRAIYRSPAMYQTSSPRGSEALPSSINARYLEHLEDNRPPLRGRTRIAVLTLIVGVLLVLGALATVFTGYFGVAWPLLPVGLVLALRGILALSRTRRAARQYDRLRGIALQGVPVTAYLVQANEALFRTGAESPLPALVLFSFEPDVDSDRDYMRTLARTVYRLKNSVQPDPDGRYVAHLTTDERPVTDRRRLLPLSFTDGSVIYCADIWLRRSDLRGGCLASNQLSCLAEPGENGGIELVPASLLPAPQQSTRMDRRLV